MQEMIQPKKRCPNCNSTLIYIRLTDNKIVCRSCGMISNVEEGLDENEDEVKF